ncbi:MAG: TIM barrel protein [Candidatus Lokiarchaeota archaeon]|nr:TIM barrel protein [Candidatus Lokiarchaeota archaeon]
MSKYLLSCRPGSYRQYAMHAYEHLPEIGVKYMEIKTPSNQEDVNFTKEMLEELNLQALSLNYPINIDDKNNIQKFEDIIPLIKQIGPTYLFSSVKVKKEKKRAKGYRILQEIGDIAKENDLFISVETHPPYNTNGDRGKETMENVDHPNIKINFDTANIYYYNKDVDGKEELKKVLPWLYSIHIKDCRKKTKDWYFPAIGDGEVDFPGIIAILDGLDKTIPLTLEIEGIKGEKLSLEDVKKRVEKSVNYLKSICKNIE